MADLSLGEKNEYELGERYLEEQQKVVEVSRTASIVIPHVQKFQEWAEPEQFDFIKQILHKMGHYQIGQVDQFIRPMLQRDFIANLHGNLFPKSLLSNNTI